MIKNFLVLITLLISVAAFSGEILGVAKIDGLVCPFCANNLKKKLDAISWIHSVSIQIDDGLANFTIKAGEYPNISEIKKAIKTGGFSPGKVRLTVQGSVKKSKKSVYFVFSKNFELIIDPNKQRRQLLKEKNIGSAIIHIEGIANTVSGKTHILIEKYYLAKGVTKE